MPFGPRFYLRRQSFLGCPSASTVDENGDPSRQHVTLCFCDAYEGIVGEDQSQPWANWSLDVDGDTTTWTFTSATGLSEDLKCITFGVSGGPLSYGQSITAVYDHSGPSPWVSMDDDLDISVSNIIGIPHIPSFDFSDSRNSHYLGAL